MSRDIDMSSIPVERGESDLPREVQAVHGLANRIANTQAAIRYQKEQMEKAATGIEKLTHELETARRDMWGALLDLDPGLREAIAEQGVAKRSEW